MNTPQLNPDPYIHIERYGFMFHIRTSHEGKYFDQWGVEWQNLAEHENSYIMQPINPAYMDAFIDLYNDLKSYSI